MLWNLKWQDEYDFRKIDKNIEWTAENTRTVFTRSFLKNRVRVFNDRLNQFVVNLSFVQDSQPTRKQKRNTRFAVPVETVGATS